MLTKMRLIILFFFCLLIFNQTSCKNLFNLTNEKLEIDDFKKIYLPKTGQTVCWNYSSPLPTSIPCAGTGQDGDTMCQRGISWPNPRFRDNGDGTITDRLTGLMWVRNGNLMPSRDPGFDNDNTINDGKVNWQNALNYAKKLANENYAGYSDWRLPNVNELHSLVNYGAPAGQGVWLNSQGFSGVMWTDGTDEVFYWSASSRVNMQGHAWYKGMQSGSINSDSKINFNYVLAVRAGHSGVVSLPKTGQTACYDSAGTVITCAGTGQDGDTMCQRGISWPNPRFINNGNGTITDRLTGLMWERVPSTNGSWEAAFTRIQNLNNSALGGYTDWRLPNIHELQSLVNYGVSNQAVWLNGQGFSGVQPDSYCSASTYASEYYLAYTVVMNTGNLDASNKSSSNFYVLAVRGG